MRRRVWRNRVIPVALNPPTQKQALRIAAVASGWHPDSNRQTVAAAFDCSLRCLQPPGNVGNPTAGVGETQTSLGTEEAGRRIRLSGLLRSHFLSVRKGTCGVKHLDPYVEATGHGEMHCGMLSTQAASLNGRSQSASWSLLGGSGSGDKDPIVSLVFGQQFKDGGSSFYFKFKENKV